MEQLANIEDAINLIRKISDLEERVKVIDKYLQGKLSDMELKSKNGKDLLARRALFVTALRENKLWPE